MGETVDVERRGAVARVVMHRGGNNAIATDLVQDLDAAFAELAADPEVRCVVLASAYEKYFSVGADLGAMGGALDREAPDAQERMAEAVRDLSRSIDRIEACPKPVIAAINGHAMGGGCELALACDYRLMVEDGRARIGLTETSLGLIPGFGGTQRLPRLVGKARALPMILEARRLSAQEAEAIGLVSRALAPEEFEAAVDELAGRLARMATKAFALVKDSVNRGLDRPLEDGLAIEAGNFAAAALSEDAVAGVVAFLSKQEPEFKGR